MIYEGELKKLLEMIIENIPTNGINQRTYSELSKQLTKVFRGPIKHHKKEQEE